MDSFINKLLIYMEPPEGWADIPKMKMQLGLQVLLHNMIMIGSILLFSKLINILRSYYFVICLWLIETNGRRCALFQKVYTVSWPLVHLL